MSSQEGETLNLGDSRLTGNPSGTPRIKIGGLAVPNGVMMRSMTGYAFATRDAEGSIDVTATPFQSAVIGTPIARIPILRGVVSFCEMYKIAFSLRPDLASQKFIRTKRVIAGLYITLGPLIISMWSVAQLTGGGGLNESDHPLVVAVAAWCMRYVGFALGWVVVGMRPRLRRMLEFHGAEHRAIWAFGSVREATVARAQRFPILHPRCGLMLMSHALILLAVLEGLTMHFFATRLGGYPDWPMPARMALMASVEIVAVPIAIGVAFEYISLSAFLGRAGKLLPWEWPGILLQRATVRKPSDTQVELAIVALEAAISITPEEREPRKWTTSGLEHDESAPGYQRPNLARPKGDQTASTASM